MRTQKIEKPVGKHFNLAGHTLSNMNVTTIEKVKVNNIQYRKERKEKNISSGSSTPSTVD